MEKYTTKIRKNREKCIELQQKMKKSPLSTYEEKVEEFCDDLNSIIEKIKDIKKELYNNFDKYSREKNVDLVKKLKVFKNLYDNLDNVSKNDEFVEQEIRCILENRVNPDIITIGEESVVLMEVYEELRRKLHSELNTKRRNLTYL